MALELTDIQAIVRIQLGLREAAPSGHLVEDLGAESGDIINLICALEERFGIELDDETAAQLETVADLYAHVQNALGV